MITSSQIRAARAMLNWSREELAKNSGVGISALMRFEGAEKIPRGNIKTFELIQAAFEKAELILHPEYSLQREWNYGWSCGAD